MTSEPLLYISICSTVKKLYDVFLTYVYSKPLKSFTVFVKIKTLFCFFLSKLDLISIIFQNNLFSMYFDIKIHILCELSQNLFCIFGVRTNSFAKIGIFICILLKHMQPKERISGKCVLYKTLKYSKAVFDINKINIE